MRPAFPSTGSAPPLHTPPCGPAAVPNSATQAALMLAGSHPCKNDAIHLAHGLRPGAISVCYFKRHLVGFGPFALRSILCRPQAGFGSAGSYFLRCPSRSGRWWNTENGRRGGAGLCLPSLLRRVAGSILSGSPAPAGSLSTTASPSPLKPRVGGGLPLASHLAHPLRQTPSAAPVTASAF